MIRPVIRSAIQPTVKAAGDVFGPNLGTDSAATYQFIDAGNFTEFDVAKQKFHIVSDGTSVSITFPLAQIVGDIYEIVATNFEGTGNPANGSPSQKLSDSIPFRFEALFVNSTVKRHTVCDIYFDLSLRKVTQGKGAIR